MKIQIIDEPYRGGQAMSVKAIETVYNGYRFRSRLEARWAVFFDTLGIKWEYEKEGYILSDGTRYLPDFWLPEQDCWVEIKGDEPTEKEIEKAVRLAELTDKHVYLFYGSTPLVDDQYPVNEENGSAYAFSPESDGYDIHHVWCECPDCGKIGIEFDGRADRLACKRCYYCERLLHDGSWTLYNYLRSDPWKKNTICPIHGEEYSHAGCPRHGANFDKGYNADSPRLIAAYTSARQARFEHGERGRP